MKRKTNPWIQAAALVAGLVALVAIAELPTTEPRPRRPWEYETPAPPTDWIVATARPLPDGGWRISRAPNLVVTITPEESDILGLTRIDGTGLSQLTSKRPLAWQKFVIDNELAAVDLFKVDDTAPERK